MQGAFAKHGEMLNRLDVPHKEVKRPEDLRGCQGLILPGGESTVMKKQMQEAGLIEPIQAFSHTFPCFGTCAGMILMASMGMLGITISRNSYGPQIASFSTPLTLLFTPPVEMHALFIRAPRIQAILSPAVQTLAFYQQEPVCVQQGSHLAASFHPELTNDLNLHHYFINICMVKQSQQPLSKTTLTKFSQTT